MEKNINRETKFIGIDIGSTSAKTIVMDADKKILHRILMPTGWSSVETADQIKKQLEETIDFSNAYVVATGYGRGAVPYADKAVTEISCHAKGASYLYPAKEQVIIDIGGQDTKIICTKDGAVTDFLMNDKCSAGTGRFLEIMANSLGVTPGELCELAVTGGGTKISSLCTVFAESEVISLIGRGEKRENIAFAVVESIVEKVVSQAKRLYQKQDNVCMTGGLCEFGYLRERLSAALKCEVVSAKDARYAGAIGAALFPIGQK